jgi:hypothetical protein
MAQFAQIQHYAAGLRGLLADAQARAPRRAEGSDRKEAVRVVLGPTGLPEEITVAANWNSKIEAGALGGAVMEAFQAAVGERMTEWTRTLGRIGWQDKVERLKKGPVSAPPQPAAAPGQIPPAFRKPMPQAQPRPLGDLAEEMISAFGKIDSFAPPAPTTAAATGTAAAGKVSISLSGNGLVSCTVDAYWANRESGRDVTDALGVALSAAKSALARTPAKPNPAAGMEGLFGEAMALLNNPSRLVN